MKTLKEIQCEQTSEKYQIGKFSGHITGLYIQQLRFLLNESPNDHYEIFKKWFTQIDPMTNQPIRLYVNAKWRFNYNKNKFLQRLVKEKYLKLDRSYNGGNSNISYLQII